ncbi:Hypothetical protein D9617_51g089040 [Elsinoe fawcettii]|nr:Hypothetical protein D9617_51g089040 [Elsinoe fawcettii]
MSTRTPTPRRTSGARLPGQINLLAPTSKDHPNHNFAAPRRIGYSIPHHPGHNDLAPIRAINVGVQNSSVASFISANQGFDLTTPAVLSAARYVFAQLRLDDNGQMRNGADNRPNIRVVVGPYDHRGEIPGLPKDDRFFEIRDWTEVTFYTRFCTQQPGRGISPNNVSSRLSLRNTYRGVVKELVDLHRFEVRMDESDEFMVLMDE